MAESYKGMKPMPGRILISEPFLQDFYFGRSVVLIAEHGDEGSFGLIINKPLGISFNEVVKGFPKYEGRIYLGGPVKTDSLFFIHRLGDRIEGSQEITDGLYWGGDLETVRDLLLTGQIGQGDIRFFIGYSGWSPDQLNQELDRNSWVVRNINVDKVITDDNTILWTELMRSMGGEYAIWASFPADPSLN